MAKKKELLKYESDVAGAVNDAFAMLEEFAGEMREAYDNTPESLQSSGVGEARSAAADALESISEADTSGELGETKVEFLYRPFKRYVSRAARRDHACEILAAAAAALDELPDDKGDMMRDDMMRDDIQTMIDDAEGVEFPGMYG